jgi:hypothetical protein
MALSARRRAARARTKQHAHAAAMPIYTTCPCSSHAAAMPMELMSGVHGAVRAVAVLKHAFDLQLYSSTFSYVLPRYNLGAKVQLLQL